jgi:hypothetical protein
MTDRGVGAPSGLTLGTASVVGRIRVASLVASNVGIPARVVGECKGARVKVRRLILLVGAVLLLAGVIGLLVPASISDSDGHSIACGNAVAADTSSAQAANDKNVVADIPIVNQIVPHTDYVSECRSSISSRRSWTIPLAVVGAIVIAASFLVRGRRTVGTGSL